MHGNALCWKVYSKIAMSKTVRCDVVVTELTKETNETEDMICKGCVCMFTCASEREGGGGSGNCHILIENSLTIYFPKISC